LRRLLPARWIHQLQNRSEASAALSPATAAEARVRIRAAAGTGAAGCLVFLALAAFRAPGLERSIGLVNDAAGALVCGALFAAGFARPISGRAFLRLALAAELVLALLISSTMPWAGYLATGRVPGLTWVVPIVILVPWLVPASPRAVLVASALAALAMPAGIAVHAAGHRLVATFDDYLRSGAAGLVAVAVAAAGARTLHAARRMADTARRMGGYELVARIGQGGMGEVWEARHLMLARPAAVKLILPDRLHGSPEACAAFVQRFTREAQVTAGLRSPHTVELFDFGMGEDGVLYYAMELLEGMNLEHFIYRHGPVHPRRAVHWLRQACHSLGEAHARGLTHRDLKPANLFVCRYGRERDFIKVLDFGLAHVPSSPADPTLTRAGAWLGTPGWMAPEQLYDGSAGPAVDVYALGGVAYWLLAGARPFESSEPAELLRMQLHDTPVPVGQRTPAPIPPGLDHLVMSCLAKRPEARPADVDVLDSALARAIDGNPWTAAEAEGWWSSRMAAD